MPAPTPTPAPTPAVRARLGTGDARTMAALPANPEVVRRYSAGVDRLRLGDALGARDLLRASVELAPEFAMGHYYLSQAWEALGYDPEAQAAATRAQELAAALPRDQKLRIEAGYHHARFEWDRELEILRALFDFYPDDLGYGLQLATAQLDDSHVDDARTTVARLRALAPNDLRVESIDLESQPGLTARQQLAALDRIGAHARERGARAMLGKIAFQEATLQFVVADPKAAQARIDEGCRIHAELGDERGRINCLSAQADAARRRGDVIAAAPLLDQAMAIAVRVGAEHEVSNILNVQGDLKVLRDELDEARRLNEQALAIRKRLCRRWCEALSHQDLASIEIEAGRLDEAERQLDAAIPDLEKFGRHENLRGAKLLRARILAARGRPREALALIEEVAAVAPPDEVGAVAIARARAWAALGDAGRARPVLAAALVDATGAGDYVGALRLRIDLAWLANDAGARAALAKEARAKQLFLLARRAEHRR